MFSYSKQMLIICLTILFSATTLNAQSWVVENRYGGSDDDQAYSLISHPDGSVTHIGYTYSLGNPGTFPNIHVVRSDQLGNPVWEQTYEMPVAMPATAAIPFTGMSIIQSVNGDLIWTAGVHTTEPNNSDIMVVRISTLNGAVIWTSIIGQNNSHDDVSTDIIENPVNGELFITGYSDAPPTQGSYDAILVHMSGNGMPFGQMKYGYAEADFGRDLVFTSSGRLVVCGSTNSLTPSYQGWMFQVDTGTLLVAWSKQYGIASAVDERLYSVMLHPNGYLYATGYRFDGNDESVLVVCADPAALGGLISMAYYDVGTGNRERGWHITNSWGNDEIVISGEAPGIIGGATDGFFMEIDQTLVSNIYRLYGTPDNDVLRCVEYTPGNLAIGPTAEGYWLVGYTDGAGSEDEHLIRTNLVGKDDCDQLENVSPVYYAPTPGAVLPALNSYPSAAPYNVDEIPVGSFMYWCSGQYIGTFQAKSGTVTEQPATALALDLQVSPQPLSLGAEATVNFTLDSNAEIEIALLDMRGRQVFTLPYSAQAGANTVNIKPSGLSSGAYVLHLKGLAEAAALNIVLME